ncbi:MAG: hypothetical protein M0D55_12275 [Elusimicrobiota bacterium]|nr:MAG: hypothetical protein M0D55_12275 [Elusimicrobiota bacterium]
MGQASKLKRTPEPLILKARLEVQRELIAMRLAQANVPEKMWAKVQSRLDAGSARLQQAHEAYVLAKTEYKHRYDDWSADVRRQWDETLATRRAEYREASARWRGMMRAMNRIPQPTASGLLSLATVAEVLKQRVF